MSIYGNDDDIDYSNCRRHGGVANIINCYECMSEAREDEYEYDREEEDEDDD